MDAKSLLKDTYNMSAMVFTSYISDLTDEELIARPGPGCNSIAWQLGHLICSESDLLNVVQPGAGPVLQADFVAKHSKENSASTNPADFCTKAQYLELFAKVKEATFKTLDQVSDEDLDKESPEGLRSYAPTLGHVFMVIGTHGMMHAGQFVPVRRALNKPILI